MIKYFSKFFYVLSGSKLSLFLLLLLFIVSSLLEAIGIALIGPFLAIASSPQIIESNPFLRTVYDLSRLHNPQYFISLLGVVLALVFCLKSLLYFWVQKAIYGYSFTQYGRLSSRLLKAYLNAPYTFFLNRDSASLINILTQETSRFCYDTLIPLLMAGSHLIILVVMVLMLASTDGLLLLLILAVLLPTFLVFYKLRSFAARWGTQSSEASYERIRTVNHSLGGVKDTFVIGCQPYFEEQMKLHSQRFANAASAFHSFQVLPRIAVETVLVIFMLALVAIYPLLPGQSIDNLIPTLSVFAIASIRLIPSASHFLGCIGLVSNSSYTLTCLYHDLSQLEGQVSLRRVNGAGKRRKFVEPQPLAQRASSTRKLTLNHQIELDSLTYYYPDAVNPAVSDVSLNIRKGESIALIGKSGSGKTTLVDIILGLLDPQKGEIRLDGVSIHGDLRAWQDLVGYIPQSIFLTDESIEKNIAFGLEESQIDPEKLQRAVQAAQLTELIEQMPQGVKTLVGERGVKLSGGQRQRVGIARALYHDREILVLDEATAALDNETERLVTESILQLSGIKTLIIIAHRLTTVKHCDRIYQLEQGRIIKSGTYEEVVGLSLL